MQISGNKMLQIDLAEGSLLNREIVLFGSGVEVESEGIQVKPH